MNKNKRILIVEVNWLGDVLFSTAAIRSLRVQHPESYIACLVHTRCQEVLADNPHINEVIVLDEEKTHRGIRGKIALICLLRAKHFDTVYLFHRSFTRTLICYLSGIAHRIGYATPKRGALLTESLSPPQGAIHRAAYYRYIVTKNVTGDKEQLRCDFFIKESDTVFIRTILAKESIRLDERVVVMHPAGNWPPKRWPKHYFAELADELIARYHCKVVFTGAKKEHALIDEIVTRMKQKVTNLCGSISLKQLGALFRCSDVLISGDSGPLHIAVALQTPVIALFGPTAQAVTGPLATRNVTILQKDIDCTIPCYKVDCPDNRCMTAIAVGDVLDCIEKNQWLQKKT